MKSLLLLSMIMYSGAAFAGSGISGGGQTVVDGQTGEWLFVDVLSPEFLAYEADRLVPAYLADLQTEPTCTTEVYRKLGPYDRLLQGQIAYWERQYAAGEKFEDAQALAQEMLKEATKAFPVENRWERAGDALVDLNRPISYTFRSTFFQLPQIQDATQVDAEVQIQAAYHSFGLTYFQHQVMARLSLKHQAAVFVKETLRHINWLYELDLQNEALEKATYYIFHDEKENLLASEFGQTLLARLRSLYQGEVTWDKVTYGQIHMSALGIMSLAVPPFLMHVENAAIKPENPRDLIIFGKAQAPAGQAWRVADGTLVTQSECP